MFKNREEAGRKLADKILRNEEIKQSLFSRKLENKKLGEEKMVLAIPRGGVVIGKELARALNCPLEVIITKKIGAPDNSELAIGAVGMLGEPVIDEALAERVGADENYLKNQIAKIKIEIKRREKEFRGDKPKLNFKNKIVIITDDGVATGATMMAGIEMVRQQNPKKIMVAVPVIARDTLDKIKALADEVICLDSPLMFFAVGQFYQDFPQISDEEVKELLK